MKYFACMLTIAGFIMLCPQNVSALPDGVSVTDPHTPSAIEMSDIVISAVPLSGAEFLELHNQTDEAVLLSDTSVEMKFTDGSTAQIVLPSSVYLIADGYVSLFRGEPASSDHLYYQLNAAQAGLDLSSLSLTRNGVTTEQLTDIIYTGTTYTWLSRKSGSSGYGSTMDNFTKKSNSTALLGYGLFTRSSVTPTVEIVEVYSRASSCGPADESVLCGDYIKLFNPTNETLDLSSYRLRSDSGSSLSGNSFQLSNIPPGGYLTVTLRDDGDDISLTDSGGYIWIEDLAGIAPYKDTIVSYPSALAANVGWSWAKDSSGVWKWTSTPSPGASNQFTIPLPQIDIPDKADKDEDYPPCGEGKFRNPSTNRCKAVTVASSLEPCHPGQSRNPETNRCRSVSLASTSLVPCGLGETRNPATNRCRSISSAVASLVPCKPGQTRNPETNRCRSSSSETSSLVPCQPGQERNPETNRCRKTNSATLAATTGASDEAADIQAKNELSWYTLAGVIGVVAGGYGIWEWRSEIAGATKRLLGGLKSP